jgi:hypothetical protein
MNALPTEELATLVELNTKRLDKMESLLATHIEACNERKEDMKQLLEVAQAIEGSVKMAKWMRSFVLYVSSFAGALYGLWKMWKGQPW